MPDNASPAAAPGAKPTPDAGPETEAPPPTAEPEAAAASQAQRPVAVINLVDSPELDRPEAFGRSVSEGQQSADAAEGGGAVNEAPFVPFEEKSYNADESRDATRQTITLWLIGLLCAIVALTFVALFARGASSGFADKEFFLELKQVLDVLVGPVITLLASAIGFYFGYKQGELGSQVRQNRPPSG